MTRSLWRKIEEIRGQPEHIRMRYVFGCLLISMAFILSIWLLSIKESFQAIGDGLPAATEKGKELLPDSQIPSLSDMLEQAAPLRVEGEEKTGQEYFEEQFRRETGEAEQETPLETEPLPQ